MVVGPLVLMEIINTELDIKYGSVNLSKTVIFALE
jgi:hypothetical protein